MTTKSLKSAIWLTLATSAAALAAGPPPGKGPGGEETSNSLSVPAIMIGGPVGNAVGCGNSLDEFGGLSPPSGAPTTSWPIDTGAYYYIQGVNKWQSDCTQVSGVDDGGAEVLVVGEWGDNLTGDARLTAGSPIRVELLMFDASGTQAQARGYEVVKLEPDTLDRLSAYGTLATPDAEGGYVATAEVMRPVVYDVGARWSVSSDDTGEYLIEEEAIGPEINATGKVVYGYNLRVPAAGHYTITFIMPNVTFTSCDAGVCANDTAQLTINVSGGGGGGGNKGKGRTK
jgi:hypothetical protein